jgi:hypothetical protein
MNAGCSKGGTHVPQLIALVLVGGVVWYAWRAFKREMARVGDELHDTEKVRNETPTQLEKGADGIWRPKNGNTGN